MTAANVIRDRRVEIGMSQARLARVTGIARQGVISKLELGEQRLTFAHAVHICRALDLPLDALAATVPKVEVVACRTCGDRPPPGFTCNACRGQHPRPYGE